MKEWVREHQRAVTVGTAVSALVLIGIAVALGWAIFSNQPQTGQVSPSPSADSSSRPSGVGPSQEPRPSGVSSRAPAPLWPPVTDGRTFLFSGIWAVSAVNDLNIRSGPGTENAAVGQLDAGDLVLVIDGGEVPNSWAHVAADGVVGFVNTGPQEGPWLQGTPTPWKSFYTSVNGVASNGSTYLAYGNAMAFDYPPYEGGESSLLLVSDDGATWTTPSTGPPGTVTDVAGGPAGWVALSTGSMIPSFTNFSADGRTWEQGHFPGGSAVAYGPAGWVVLGGNEAWRSADGRSWSDPVALGQGDTSGGTVPDRIESSEAGYLAFARGPYIEGSMWASANGATWVPVNVPADVSWIADVELQGNRLVVVLREGSAPYGEGHSLLLRGTLAASGAVTWNAPPAPIDNGLIVDSISHGPDGLLALGWDVGALVPVLWRSADGASWQRLNAPTDSLGGSVGPEPAWGAGGWVGLGTSVDAVGQQLWRSADGVSWSPTGDPVELMTRPPCPPPGEVSTLVLMYLGPFAEQCFGDTSVTVRGWVPLVEGLGGCCFPVSKPEWIAGVYPGAYLMPGESDQWSASLNVYFPPGISPALFQSKTWVEVVGHFHDAAAASCRSTPLAMYPPGALASQAAVRRGCEQRFVVESITAADGP